MTLNEVEQKKKDQEKNKQRMKFIKLYIIPIISIIAFLAIVFFVDLGKISEVFGALDQIAADNDEVAKLNTELTQNRVLDNNASTILRDLQIVNEIAASSSTQLITFRDKVSQLVSESSLQILSQQLSETPLTVEQAQSQQNASGNVNLIELPFIFEISGSLANIKTFISKLNSIDDFTIVKEMELSSLESETLGEWSLKITLVKYQFITSEALDRLYQNVPATAKISSQMQEYIDLRK